MEYLKEANKNLISLRASLITAIIVISGGISSLFFIEINPVKLCILTIFGVYFDFLFISNITIINRKIDKNIGDIKNGCS